MKKIFISLLATFALPLVASAALTYSCSSLASYDNLLGCAMYILNSLIPIIIALIIVWIIWSAFQFAKADGEERNAHRDSMVWGIVAIFIAVSIYGLVNILTGTFGTATTSTSVKAPNVTTSITQ